MKKKRTRKHTAARHRQKATEHKLKLQVFWMTGAVTFAIIAVIAGLGYGWFATNNTVRGAGTSISGTSDNQFALATLKDGATQGIYDDNTQSDSPLLSALGYSTVSDLLSLSVGQSVYTYDQQEYILGDSDGISLMVNEGSNVNNLYDEQRIGPGSEGQFTFYIIPQTDTCSSVTVTVAIDGYTVEENDTGAYAVEVRNSTALGDAKQKILNCICGHLLLFASVDEDGNYSGRVVPELTGDNRIVFTLPDISGFTKDVPYPVTLYWVWPHHFEDLIYPGREESVLAEAGDDRAALVSWINQNKTKIHDSADTLADIDTENITNEQLLNWNMAYNRGDQLIGKRVAFFHWIIEATNS